MQLKMVQEVRQGTRKLIEQAGEERARLEMRINLLKMQYVESMQATEKKKKEVAKRLEEI